MKKVRQIDICVWKIYISKDDKNMRNIEELKDLREQGRNLIERKRDEFVRNSLLSDEFLEMLEKNKKPMDLLMSYYKCALMEIETKFKVLNQEYLLRKIRKKDIPLTLDSIEKNITDIAGVRVICSFPDDIYEIAESFLKQDDITLIEKKDYIQNPKPSGYRSLHLIVQVPIFLQNTKKLVTVEVQLRTIAMDFWASLEHKMRYKKNISPDQVKFLQDELSDCARQSAALDERMQNIRNVIIQNSPEEEDEEGIFLPLGLPITRENRRRPL